MINMFTERGQTDLKPSTATSSCSSLDSQYEPISRLCISGRQILKKTKQDSHDVKVNMSEGVGDSLCADGRYGVVLQSGCNYALIITTIRAAVTQAGLVHLGSPRTDY